MSKIYLCHKCHGNLDKPVEGLHGCGCMSGWIRDWQKPVEIEVAKAMQHQQSIKVNIWEAERAGDNERAAMLKATFAPLLEIDFSRETIR